MRLLLTVIISLSLLLPVFGQWNLNGDCIVNHYDYAPLADGWSVIYDVNDLAGMAGQWLDWTNGDPNRSPEISDESFAVVQGDIYTFQIAATSSEALVYGITSLPENGTLFDSASTEITAVPYNLPDSSISYQADRRFVGTDSFVFVADDQSGLNPPCGGIARAKASVTVTASTIPHAADINISTDAYEQTFISLDGYIEEGKLQYFITSIPAFGWLQDGAEYDGPITAGNLPYRLVSGHPYFITDSNDVATFNYKVKSGGNLSNEATVTIDVNDAPGNYLYFDNNGIVDVPNDPNLNLVSGWGVGFFVSTRACDGTLLEKRDDITGTGWDISLNGGRLLFRAFDANGLAGFSQSPAQINDGGWNLCSVQFVHTGDPNSNVAMHITGEYGLHSGTFAIIPEDKNYTNEANVIAASGYTGRLDRIRFYSGIAAFNDILWSINSQVITDRTDPAETMIGMGYISALQYPMDDGNDIIVTETKVGNNGLIIDSGGDFWIGPKQLYRRAPKQGRSFIFEDNCFQGRQFQQKLLIER